jgi:plasmid stability protein
VDKTTVYLDEEIRLALRAAARRSGRAQAELIREALTEYLARQDRPILPSFVASIGVGGDAGAEKQLLRAEYLEDLQRRKGGSA